MKELVNNTKFKRLKPLYALELNFYSGSVHLKVSKLRKSVDYSSKRLFTFLLVI